MGGVIMKRWTFAASAAAALLAAAAIAGTGELSKPNPAETGKASPHARSADRAHRGEPIQAYVPNLGAGLEGQTTSAFVLP
jgi:hypothetical protein